MKKIIYVLSVLLLNFCLSAQEVVSTQGDSYSNANATIDFTIGEVIVDTSTDGVNEISQGFHQYNWNIVGIEDFSFNYEATVFPNPTSDLLNIRAAAFQNVTYTLYDAQGKVIIRDELSAEHTTIQVGELAPGNYSLILNDDTKTLKSFNLINQ